MSRTLARIRSLPTGHLLLAAVGLALCALATAWQPEAAVLHAWLARLGPWMVVASLALMILGAASPFPAHVVAVANGMLFGSLGGIGISWLGAMIGSWASYRVARHLTGARASHGREAADGRIARLVRSGTFAGLIGVRLVPGIPLFGVNYATGYLGVPPGRFLATTALGILPATVACTWAGVQLAGAVGLR